MGIFFGLYVLGVIFTTVLILLLASTTFHPLKRYLEKWNEMRPIPGMAGAYPIIGNALQFKTNAGGKSFYVLLLRILWHMKQSYFNIIVACFFWRFFQPDYSGHKWKQTPSSSKGLGGSSPLSDPISCREYWGAYCFPLYPRFVLHCL